MGNFQLADYVVFLATLAVSLGIGIFYSCRQKSTEEYFHGNRQLQLLPVAISLVATFTSAFSMLGTPAEIYAYGTQYSMHIFGVIWGTVLGALLFVPLFHPLDLPSAFEYIRRRYRSGTLKLTANILELLSQIIFNGLGMLAPSFALQTVTGMPVWLSMVICGVTMTIYTSIGGMKAVIWTDVFQSIIIYSGIITVCVMGWIKVGGIQRAFQLNKEWGRLNFFIMDPDPTLRASFWSNVFYQGVLYFCLSSVQPSFLRYSGLPTLKQAKQSLYLNAVGVFISGLLFSMVGFVAFAYYAGSSCDPLRAGMIRSPNQILPYFVMDIISIPGLTGLFVACFAGAALSTSSSTLNGCAAMIWHDLLSVKFGHLSEKAKTTISKAIVLGLGVLSLAAGFVMMHIKGTLIQMVLSIGGALIGPNTGLYFLGAVNPRPNAKAAMIGFVTSVSFVFLLSIGSNLSKVHLDSLPSPVIGCHLGDVYTDDAVLTNTSLLFGHMNHSVAYMNLDSTTVFPDISNQTLIPPEESSSGQYRSYLQKFFSISYLYYPLFGVSITTIVGSLLSIHPYFAADYYVEDKHLFTFVRYIRKRFFAKDSTISQNHEKYEMEPLDSK